MDRRRKRKSSRSPTRRPYESVPGATVVAVWVTTLLIVGGTVLATIAIYRRQHYVHLPVHWIVICIMLLGGAIWITIRRFKD